MKRYYVLILILTTVLAACGKPTPDPDLVAQAVQATLSASAPAETVTAPEVDSPAEPTTAGESAATAEPAPTSTIAAPTQEPAITVAPTVTPVPPTATLEPTSPPEPTATPAFPYVMANKVVNLRAGPGTDYAVVGRAETGKQYEITGRNPDGAWLEICCINDKAAWVAKSVITVGGDAGSVQVAANIPAPPPSPTPQPTSPPEVKPTTAAIPAIQRPTLHSRIQIGTWEIQAERVQNEKAVYQYDSSKVAMGRYAIVFVLARNLASGTQSISSSLAPVLRDDKGRLYDYSDPWSTERLAMIYAMWEFSVGKSVFSDVNPGVETPLLMLWDVNEDAQSLTLLLTDGRNRVEWDLGNFSNIPPYQP